MRLIFELGGIAEAEMEKLRQEALAEQTWQYSHAPLSKAPAPVSKAITHLCGHTFLVNHSKWNSKCPTCGKFDKARKL